jgi:DnaJ-class molecular chaperone
MTPDQTTQGASRAPLRQVQCEFCGGEGKTYHGVMGGNDPDEYSRTCSACNGDGWYVEEVEPCPTCRGGGVVLVWSGNPPEPDHDEPCPDCFPETLP